MTNQYMKKIAIILWLCCLPAVLSAKDFAVKGKVVNEKTEKIVIGAKLKFEDIKKPEKIFYTTEVGKDGFHLPDMKVSSGKDGSLYKVTIEAEGYEPFTGTVTIYYSKTGSYELQALRLNPLGKPGSVKGVIKSKRTKSPLANATVVVNNQSLTTDSEGAFVYSVDKIYYFTPLDVSIKTDAFGYQSSLQKMSFELTLKNEPHFTFDEIFLGSAKVEIEFKGKIVDYFGGAPTQDVEISIDQVAAKTQADGSYTVKGLKIDYELEGKYKVVISKKGYITGNHEFTVHYANEGVLTMDTLQIHHEPLEAPKFLKPEKLVYSLRPAFEWQLPEIHKNDIKTVTLIVSINKDYTDAQSIALPNAPTKTVFPHVGLERLKAETAYFAKLTYTLKREQESLPAEFTFTTAAMQPTAAPLPPSPITSGASIDLYPTWAQDGKTFYYTSNASDDSQQIFEIFSKRTDRLGMTSKITNSMAKSSDIKPSAGPENEMVSYLSNRIGVNNIWSIRTGENQNRAPMQLTSFETQPIHWISCAKDSKRIVYCREKIPSNVKRNTTDLEIWMLNVSDGVKTILEVGGTQVKVSPDGDKILYVSDKQGPSGIWMYDISKGQVSQLVVELNEINTDPCWTKDGSGVIYSSNRTGNFDLWVKGIRENKVRQLTNSLADERYPDCNSVTNEILYCSDESGIWKLKKITLPEE